MKGPVYVDSNVFIYSVIYDESSKAVKAKEILNKIEKSIVIAYTSVLTWDEVVWVVLRTLGRADALQIGEKLLKFPNLRFIDVNEAILIKSNNLMDTYKVSPRDAIHLSSAMLKGMDTMVSDDQDFEVVKEITRVPVDKF